LREIEPNGNLFMIFTLAAAAFILLFISLINYINLNLGMAVFSDRYLHISRIYGSSNFTRLTYHMAEGLIVVLISIALSILLITTTHRLLMQHFALNLMKGNTLFILFIMMVFGMLSVFPSIMVMLRHGLYRIKTGFRQQHNHHLYRKGVSKGLIVFQYAISTALVISVIVMMRQTSFSLKASLGNDSGQLVCMEDVHSDVQKKFPVFKEELLKYKSIIAVTAMLDPPGGEANDMFEFEMEGFRKGTEKNQIGILSCDYSFAKVFDLKFLAGTDFSPTNTDHDGSGEYIINRSALKRLGYGQPEAIIGKPFRLLFDDTVVKFPSGTIIGVVDDFHLSGIRKKVEPMVLFKRNDMWLINFVVKSEPGMQVKALSDMERVWKEMFPEHPFEYRTVSSIYRHVYKSELLQLRLLSLFTFLALFMCSMGLLGLSLLTAQRRTKEIGIRVVNGARTGEILFMLNWSYLKWILLSFIIAFPLAWFGMNKWLENFVYKTSLDTWIFVVASITTIVIAMMTVSFQSWSAARRNPVEALRYE
jgi:putative ABC transport system permease protein